MPRTQPCDKELRVSEQPLAQSLPGSQMLLMQQRAGQRKEELLVGILHRAGSASTARMRCLPWCLGSSQPRGDVIHPQVHTNSRAVMGTAQPGQCKGPLSL